MTSPGDHVSHDDLRRYALRDLPEARAADVAAHVNGCLTCRRALTRARLAAYRAARPGADAVGRSGDGLMEAVAYRLAAGEAAPLSLPDP